LAEHVRWFLDILEKGLPSLAGSFGTVGTGTTWAIQPLGDDVFDNFDVYVALHLRGSGVA